MLFEMSKLKVNQEMLILEYASKTTYSQLSPHSNIEDHLF